MSVEQSTAASTGLRLDKWLWFARFYKTRSLAAKAVAAGHVRLNGARIKPSRAVVVGDTLAVHRGIDVLECAVRALPARRGSATEARRCYEETEQSRGRRELRQMERRAMAGALARPTEGRPDKRTRRMLRDRFRGSENR